MNEFQIQENNIHSFHVLILNDFQKNAEKRLQESIEKTKQDCEQKAAEELARVVEIHKDKCDELNQR